MALLPIVTYPDPLLQQVCRPVGSDNAGVAQLVADMTETMYAAEGAGLAAIQVGEPIRLFIIDSLIACREAKEAPLVFIDPEVLELSTETETSDEGCLSFPDISLDVERPNRATIEATDLDGERFTITAEGFLARAMLHEIEHLDGAVFLRNVSPLKREMVKRRIKKRMRSGDWEPAVAQ